MEIRAEEISEIIKKQIKGYGKDVEVAETGTIISVGDGIARIHGLDKAMAGELLEFPGGISGMVLNLEEDNVGAAILGDYEDISARGVFLDHEPALVHGLDLERMGRQAEAHRCKRHAGVDEYTHAIGLDEKSGAPDPERFSCKRDDVHRSSYTATLT